MGTILIAEDSATHAVQIRALLERDGHTVVMTVDGQQAVDALDTIVPDLVITDLNMPNMNGLELVEHIRDHHSETPVVLMTGEGSEDTAVQALRLGATSYLPKRELAQSLNSTVSEILDLIDARRSKDEVMDALIAEESTFVIGNDHRFASQVIAHLEDQLRSMKYSDPTGMLRITMAVREAVANAIDHGNLELDSDMRDEDGPGYSDLGQKRSKMDPWMHRQVTITSRVTPDQVRYTVTDQGPGFDPSSLPDPLDPENLLRAHGRGLMLIRSFMDEVSHNETGNAITMVKYRDAIPAETKELDRSAI